MAAAKKTQAQKKNKTPAVEEPVQTVEESPQAVQETVQAQTEAPEAPQGVLEAAQNGNVDPTAVLASMGTIEEPTKKTGKKNNGQKKAAQKKAQEGQPKAESAPEWYSLETEAVLAFYDTRARLAKLNGQLAFQMKAEEEERMDEVIDGLKIAIADLEERMKAMAEPEPHRIRSALEEVGQAIQKVEADLKKRKAVYDGLADIYAHVEEEALARVAPQEDD